MATSFLYYKAVVYKDKVHRPLGTDERLSSDSIPISALPNNALRVVEDGLYVGAANSQSAYYVSTSVGTDVPTSGTKVQPYKTIKYALDQIMLQWDANAEPPPASLAGTVQGSVTLALKAGETFPLTRSYELLGFLRLTFYGDPQYGDFDSPTVGLAEPAYISDLLRPIIAPTIQPETVNGVNHFQAHGVESTLRLYGVQVDLPAGGIANSDYCSFFNTAYSESGHLQLWGTIVNKLDASSSYGIFGVHSRSPQAILEQYCSQFRVQGQVLQPVPGGFQPTANQLLTRQYFIIFYPDFAGNNQSGGALLPSGTQPSGLMQLLWSDVASAPIPGGKTNLPSYPLLNDPAYGIGQYFYNLARDNQSRPLNVQCAFLF